MHVEPEETLTKLKSVARSLGIVDVGVASASAWEDGRAVEGKRPKDVMTSCRSVIVLSIPLQATVLDTAPSIYYSHLYSTVNSSLDLAAERLALELSILGHDAVYVPRDGYKGIRGLRKENSAFFSHKLAAYYAGMGAFGMNGLILTGRHGPRMRLVSVLTSAELPSGNPLSDALCTGCGLCAEACPAGAIGELGIDAARCLDCNEGLSSKGISPCGRCVAACPVGTARSAPPSEKGRASISAYRLRRHLNNCHA